MGLQCQQLVRFTLPSHNLQPPAIPVGSLTNYLVYDSANGEIFVTTGTDNAVLVISDHKDVVLNIQGGKELKVAV